MGTAIPQSQGKRRSGSYEYVARSLHPEIAAALSSVTVGL
jgi:hypothetical protein